MIFAPPLFRPALLRSPIAASGIVRPGASLDPDAAAYIAAITNAGATVSSLQSTAINAFIVAEKQSGRWAAAHKRIFFPVWAVAAANAICMRSLATGTWVNSPTMAAGYVQGNGTTQYFDCNTSFSAQGIANNSFGVWNIGVTSPTNTNPQAWIGTFNANNAYLVLQSFSGTQIRAHMFFRDYILTNPRAEHLGILFAGRNVDEGRDFYLKRRFSGISYLADTVIAASGIVPTANVFAMALNQIGATPNVQSLNNSRTGGFGFCLGLDKSSSENFTLNLKTLWETVTGLTLP